MLHGKVSSVRQTVGLGNWNNMCQGFAGVLLACLHSLMSSTAVGRAGQVMVDLVHEFLQWCNMEFTLKVFEPELGLGSDYRTRSELVRQLVGTAASNAVASMQP